MRTRTHREKERNLVIHFKAAEKTTKLMVIIMISKTCPIPRKNIVTNKMETENQ